MIEKKCDKIKGVKNLDCVYGWPAGDEIKCAVWKCANDKYVDHPIIGVNGEPIELLPKKWIKAINDYNAEYNITKKGCTGVAAELLEYYNKAYEFDDLFEESKDVLGIMKIIKRDMNKW